MRRLRDTQGAATQGLHSDFTWLGSKERHASMTRAGNDACAGRPRKRTPSTPASSDGLRDARAFMSHRRLVAYHYRAHAARCRIRHGFSKSYFTSL